MMKCCRAILLLAGSLPGAAAVADPALIPFDAEYRVKIKGLRGEMHMSLAGSDDRYFARSSITPRGFARLLVNGEISEQAEFYVGDGILVPLHYESVDTMGGDDEAVTMDFDAAAGQATVSINERDMAFALGGPTFDRVSIQYAVMLGLSLRATAPDYAMLDGDRLKPLSIRYDDSAPIRVPYGEFAVRKVQHQARNSSRVTTLWCAAELGFLPVRIEQHRKGKLQVRAELTEYRPR